MWDNDIQQLHFSSACRLNYFVDCTCTQIKGRFGRAFAKLTAICEEESILSDSNGRSGDNGNVRWGSDQ